MMVMPVSPNMIYIPMMPDGCCRAGFDSTYPAQLHGIIRPEEFQESVANINKTLQTRKVLLILLLIFVVGILIGMGLFIAGGITTVLLRSTTFLALVGAGGGIFVLVTIVFTVGACILQVRQSKRMRAAIAAESAKYSSRSPTPCSWRLDINSSVAGYGRNRRAVRVNHLVIDIGRPMGASGGQAGYQYNQVNPYPPPYGAPSATPSYSAQARSGFCARCGTPRANPTMKFCASCGQSFP